MGHLREIPRTASFAWSAGTSRPLIATGTRAGAVNADFSDETKLELWDLDLSNAKQAAELSPLTSLSTTSRFHDLAWCPANGDRSQGIIAGALESGTSELWDASILLDDPSNASQRKIVEHTGPVKALQFNPFRHELLATSGVKGELFITDLNSSSSSFRLGSATARVDDFDGLDWNKKIPHILVTGSSGGFVTVWDVKAKKESLTLNNLGRKPVSAVAWNPDVSTKLATAIPSDQDPLILLWDLRNTGAPERTLKAHDQGVLSLSWCAQDSDLLLSCGKDNRNICWNSQTGESLGEFPIVTNWTFQTRWSPCHPNLLATASFDGKIAVQTIQNTNKEAETAQAAATQAAEEDDFFAKAQNQPQGALFSLKKTPKWLRKPVGASFGFGGKVVSFGPSTESPKRSTIKITTFAAESGVETSIEEFQNAIREDDISQLCSVKIAEAPTELAKADWKVMQDLSSTNPRKTLLAHLGFSNTAEDASESVARQLNGEKPSETKGANGKIDSEDSFFNEKPNDEGFLADLASSKGTKTNSPFQLFAESEPSVEKDITSALMLASFEKAVNICLKENRMSDAFMVAICGGQKCIDKVQSAYFAKQSEGPMYLRLLASVVGKNLWDIVHNAALKDWAAIMATLCTYADEKEFPDLCEALGDRIDEASVEDAGLLSQRQDATFCYLAGSKLEKLVPIWIKEMDEAETVQAQEAQSESGYAIHARALQNFIEKVTVFRKASNYQDQEDKEQVSGFKLSLLYAKYAEYAEVVAAHGHLDLAEQYLSYLPPRYPAADVAMNRIKQATAKKQPAGSKAAVQRTVVANRGVAGPIHGAPYQQSSAPAYGGSSSYTSPYGQQSYMSQQVASPYAPSQGSGAGYLPPSQSLPPPPQGAVSGSPVTGPPPPKGSNAANWNDTPEFAAKPPTSRRGTPAPVSTPFIGQTGVTSPNMSHVAPQQPPQKSSSPLPPPPKAGVPPPRGASPLVDRNSESLGQPQRSPSAAAISYVPQQSQPNQIPAVQPPMQIRSSSPYNPPPVGPPASNRYAPAPNTQPMSVPSGSPAPPLGSYRPPPTQGNQYAPQRPSSGGQFAPAGPGVSVGSLNGPPTGPPRAPQQGPTAGTGPSPSSASSMRAGTPTASKYPSGDRTHISAESRPIFTIMNTEMQRIKSKAPASYKREVDDTERRLNLLFDHLNNDDLLKPQTIQELKSLAGSIQSRDFDQAQVLLTGLIKSKMDTEGGNWLVGVKRLVSMSRATPV